MTTTSPNSDPFKFFPNSDPLDFFFDRLLATHAALLAAETEVAAQRARGIDTYEAEKRVYAAEAQFRASLESLRRVADHRRR